MWPTDELEKVLYRDCSPGWIAYAGGGGHPGTSLLVLCVYLLHWSTQLSRLPMGLGSAETSQPAVTSSSSSLSIAESEKASSHLMP